MADDLGWEPIPRVAGAHGCPHPTDYSPRSVRTSAARPAKLTVPAQLSDDQLRNLVAELERRFRDEALTSAAQAATIILDGVKADRWRILVGPDAHKIDEMVRQSPERAYDIAFFDEFARAAGWTERLSLENPEFRPPS